MCEYFCIGFIDFMLIRKSLLQYANLFSLSKYEKNDKLNRYYIYIYIYIYIVLFVIEIQKL